MRNIFNVLGWILLLISIVIGGNELYEYLDRGDYGLSRVGDLWARYAPDSLAAFQSALAQFLYPTLWDNLVRPLVLGVPALLAALVLAVVFLLAARIGRVEDSGSGRRARRRRSSGRLS